MQAEFTIIRNFDGLPLFLVSKTFLWNQPQVENEEGLITDVEDLGKAAIIMKLGYANMESSYSL